MALSHLLSAEIAPNRVAHPHRERVERMIRTRTGCVSTSSAGRLFDAVASLAGVHHRVTYEGQAAVELEAICEGDAPPYPLPVVDGELLEIDPRPLIRAVLGDLDRGERPGRVSARFHAAAAGAIAETCETLRDRTGLRSVALSGGCFQNRRLTRLATAQLRRAGFEVLLHRRVPPNDGGISLGQAAVAAWRRRDVPGDPR
jgi:hydrogenase maturation protein HypF